jgi:hypothetical protein
MARQPSKTPKRTQAPARSGTQRKARSRFTPEYGLMLEMLHEQTLQSGVTQQHIARHLGKSQSHVSMCWNKEREISFVDLWKWCEAIGINFTEFVARFEKAVKRSHRS